MNRLENRKWGIGNQRNSVAASSSSESGMVSLTVTLIMMIVITLIVIGFAQVVRRNSREQLDSQLSAQAYYAAESGVNDAYQAVFVDKLVTPADFSSHPEFKTSCNGFLAFLKTKDPSISNNLSSDGSVGYTCMFVSNLNRSAVVNVPYGANISLPLLASSPPGTLTFAWDPGKSVGGALQPSNCSGAFVASSSWTTRCPYGILRVDLYDADRGSGAADVMADQTVSIFMIPRTSGASQGIVFGDPARSTYKVNATCSATQCKATINGMGDQNYYARITSVYEGLGNVTVTASNPNVEFSGQLMVDVTGKAQDELRRVQVRLRDARSSDSMLPANALSSGSAVCKQFTTLGSGHNASDGNDSDIPSELCPSP